jgi:Thiamine monophosphate synthase
VDLPAPPVLLITDRKQARRPLEEVVAGALRGGCRWISLREKDLPDEDQAALALRLVRLAAPFGARLMLHGDPRIARETNLFGVHLAAGGDVRAARAALGSAACVSASAHSVDEILAAAAAGADAVTLSPIFSRRKQAWLWAGAWPGDARGGRPPESDPDHRARRNHGPRQAAGVPRRRRSGGGGDGPHHARRGSRGDHGRADSDDLKLVRSPLNRSFGGGIARGVAAAPFGKAGPFVDGAVKPRHFEALLGLNGSGQCSALACRDAERVRLSFQF